jgi:hypothetical protein
MTIEFLHQYHQYLTDLVRDSARGEERERLRKVRTTVAAAIAFWPHP